MPVLPALRSIRGAQSQVEAQVGDKVDHDGIETLELCYLILVSTVVSQSGAKSWEASVVKVPGGNIDQCSIERCGAGVKIQGRNANRKSHGGLGRVLLWLRSCPKTRRVLETRG